MRMGLFGGTFDPPHIGHLLMARLAAEHAKLARIIFIPAAQSPMKPCESRTSSHDRLEMVRLCLHEDPEAEASSIEIDREGVSYSIETTRELRARMPEAEFYWILGSDQWALLPQWRNFDELKKLTRFIVFPRPNPPAGIPDVHHLTVHFRFDISSTLVRQRIKKSMTIAGFVPPSVERYIRSKGLYA